jgi:ParB/RepB/Spo0J family partition protein
MPEPFYRIETSIPVSEIDVKDQTHRITTRPCTEDLVNSIRESGVINAPIISGKAPGFTVISGFRRIDACRALGMTRIDARVILPEISGAILARIAITENSLQRPLNLIEKSRCIALLARWHPTPEEMSMAASRLGLPSHPNMVSKLEKLNGLPKQVQDAICSEMVSFPIAMILLEMEPATAVSFTNLFVQFKLGVNHQREILELAREIALRENISMDEVLSGKDWAPFREDPDMDKGLKMQKLMTYLKKRRYPEKSAAEDEFREHVKRLKLGSGVFLKHPKDFEGRTFSLIFHFDNLNLLKEKKLVLDKIVNDHYLKNLIEN